MYMYILHAREAELHLKPFSSSITGRIFRFQLTVGSATEGFPQKLSQLHERVEMSDSQSLDEILGPFLVFLHFVQDKPFYQKGLSRA